MKLNEIIDSRKHCGVRHDETNQTMATIKDSMYTDGIKLARYMAFASSDAWHSLPCLAYVNRENEVSGRITCRVERLQKLSDVSARPLLPPLSVDEIIFASEERLCELQDAPLSAWKMEPGAVYIPRSHPMHLQLTKSLPYPPVRPVKVHV